ncbi:MAG: hypothetical protein H0W83_00645 [Planctomycetes bacterium]|nr:hypothetical protein [Planctomycetota bacterium]
MVIVAGLCMILLTLAVTFLVKMRMDSQESIMLVRDAQARIMLVSALQYIQESSRLGWRDLSKIITDPWGDGSPGYETYGWTDVRDGSIGPRGPRYYNPTSAGDPKQDTLTQPTWWPGAGYPQDADGKFYNAYTYAVGSLPASGSRKWPCPGSAMRGDMYVEVQPRFAVRLQKVANPFYARSDEANSVEAKAFLDDPSYTTATSVGDLLKNIHFLDGASVLDGPYPNAPVKNGIPGQTAVSWIPFMNQWRSEGFGGLDPQPVSATLALAKIGDDTPRPTSANLGWFRIYRELPSDHDMDGIPYFDHVPLEGHGVFIIACGGGATKGYRFWNAADPGYSIDLEPVTAQNSGLFVDESMFREMRASERILWYRAEWTAASGGSANTVDHYNVEEGVMSGQFSTAGSYSGNNQNSWGDTRLDNRRVSFFGSFKWIQRLERDPVKW